jgi:hypothetical protein
MTIQVLMEKLAQLRAQVEAHGYKLIGGEIANAEEVRSDQGQDDQPGQVVESGQEVSGPDLQQPAQAGTGSGDPEVQVATANPTPSSLTPSRPTTPAPV